MKDRISYVGSCRGDGKLYLMFKGCLSSGLKCVSKLRNGEVLPSHCITMSDSEFVVSLADFQVEQHLLLVAADGRVIYSKVVNPVKVALESKINGLVRKRLCSDIRCIDKYGARSVAPIVVTSYIPLEHGVIVRGLACSNAPLADSRVAAYDEEGQLVCFETPLSAVRSEADGFERRFSLHLPQIGGGLCLALIDRDGVQTGAFLNMKPRHYIECVRSSFERCANATDQPRYIDWLSSNLLTGSGLKSELDVKFSRNIKFSIIVPLYKTPIHFFKDMADSVLAQTYRNWELVLVNSTPEISGLHDLVIEYANSDSRIRYVDLGGNYGITENTNEGIKVATGDYYCFFDHDDVLEPDILFEYAKAIESDPTIDLLYCDEDKLYPDGSYANPTFKPDFSLDMARDNNYICHLLTVKAVALEKIELSGSELDGAQDHAMVLKIAELGGTIHHVPKLLYHWRISETSTAANSESKPYATIAGIKAVQQHLDRVGVKATVGSSHGRAFRYSPDYYVDDEIGCSIIVATPGSFDSLPMIVAALEDTGLKNIELVVACPNLHAFAIEKYLASKEVRFQVLARKDEFNLSIWRNACARAASGDLFIFVCGDIMPVSSNWLHVLAGFALREDVGVVGTMTCDADGVIRQAGLSYVDDKIICLSKGVYKDSPGYIFMPLTVRDVAAVDGACHAVSRAAFIKIGGYSENYLSNYSDVDFCFRASSLNLKVIYTPEAALYRHSPSADERCDCQIQERRFADKSLLLATWADRFACGDKWFSPHFSKVPSRAQMYQFDVND